MILSLSSCEKDDSFKDQAEDSQINATESGFYTEYVESPAISKNANLTKQLSKSLTNPENVMGRGERTELTLHTQIAKYISSEDGSYHSYTFHVSNTPEGEGLENVLYASSDGGKSYRIYLLEYPYTEEKMINSFLPFKPLDFKGEHIAYYPLNEESKTNTVDCIMVIQGYCAGKQNHTDGLLHGYPCPANQTISSYLDCSITSSGGDGETTSPGIPYNPYPFNDSSPDGSSSGDGGIGNPSSGTDVTSPLYLPMKSVIRKLAPYEDEAEEDHIKQCLSDNSMLTIPLEMFLGENPTPEQEAFGKEAIKAKCENSDADVDFENKLILDFEASDCLNNIINTLKYCSSEVFLLPEIPTNVNLASLILNTFDNVSNHGLKIRRDNLPSNINASTTPSSLGNNTFMYTITINNSFLQNATDLAVVRTIIHEILHAYLSYEYQDQPFSDFSSTLRYHLSQNGFDDNVAQHQIMVDFVTAIAYALQNWDNNSLNGLNYYKYLAWSGGLLNTPEFNAQTSTFQNNVVNANIAEGDANSPATSSAQGTNNCN